MMKMMIGGADADAAGDCTDAEVSSPEHSEADEDEENTAREKEREVKLNCKD